MICCPLIGCISLASAGLSWWKSLYIDVLVSSHGGAGIALFCMVIPRPFIKESMLAAALGWFFLGVLKLYCWCVHSSLVGSIYLHLSACGSFVSCMGSYKFACVFTFFYLDQFLVFLFDLACWGVDVHGSPFLHGLCMVFHLIWLGGSFWLVMDRSLNVMMKGLCIHLHMALFAW